MKEKAVNILGIRGLPAAHGGFETFAHNFALHLVDQGWDVRVYCQHDSNDASSPLNYFEDEWEGVKRVHISVKGTNPFSTVLFDLACVRDVLNRPGVDLVLGYNTAVFCLLQRLSGRKFVMNMDGVEWRRDKWSIAAKIWFYLNEFIGCHVSRLAIADHPEIAQHLTRHGCTNAIVIPYASETILDAASDPLREFGLISGGYFVSIARIEPENSILEIVRAYSEKPRYNRLVVLGNFRDDNAYHRKIKEIASEGVIFPGAIYDKMIVQALRVHAVAYIHGHQVGGTNPSLVEALGTGSAVIAHDNKFNRWVAGQDQFYFEDYDSLKSIFDDVDGGRLSLEGARKAAAKQHESNFTFEIVHSAYEAALLNLMDMR